MNAMLLSVQEKRAQEMRQSAMLTKTTPMITR